MRILLIAAVALAVAADPPAKNARPEAVTDPAKAGRDFALQGEFRGEAAKVGRGAMQVVAEGDGKFVIRLLPRGLPGDGWDGETEIRTPAETADGKTAFDCGEFTGKFAEGTWHVSRNGGTAVCDKVVRKSPTEGKKPPAGAVVLFDGTSADGWEKGKLVESNLLDRGVTSRRKFGDFTLHLEFRTPYMPKARGQQRGNSGVYLQGRYEIQILDSFGLEGKDNECGGVYQVAAPKVNMCFPPLFWQTYDIDFAEPRFDANGKKTADAVVTVRHNGVVIHDKLKIPGPTGGALTKEGTGPGPIHLQDHDDPVAFRNIWVVEKNPSGEAVK